MVVDLGVPHTQAAVAAIVGVSQQAISAMQTEGRLPADGTTAEIVHAYCARLREQAAGRASDGPLDLAQERAALAREQRAGLEIKNAVLRGQYASIELLADVLATASQAVSQRFDHLPGVLKKACPDLSDTERDQIVAVIASARNEWARATAELVRIRLAETDDEPELDLGDPTDDAAID